MKYIMIICAALASQVVVGQGEDFAVLLTKAQRAFDKGRHQRALDYFKRCADATSDSEAAWLGVQRSYMALSEWAKAREAGLRAFKLNDENFFAISRLALTSYMLADYVNAKRYYQKALLLDAESALMRLGLGFTEHKLGSYHVAMGHCRAAAKVLANDPRVLACLAIKPPKPIFRYYGGAAAAYYGLLSSQQLLSISSVTAAGGYKGKKLTLWLGTTMTLSRDASSSYKQLNPVFGVGYRGQKAYARASFSWLFADSTVFNHSKVVSARVGYDGSLIGAYLSGAASFYGGISVVQLDPRLKMLWGERFTVEVGPELILLLSQSPTGMGGNNGPNGRNALTAQSLWSGHVQLRIVPHPKWALSLRAYGGRRSYMVEHEGLSLWNNNDVYVAGYRCELGIDVHRRIAVSMAFRHEFGVEQAGMAQRFQLLGGNLGVYFSF